MPNVVTNCTTIRLGTSCIGSVRRRNAIASNGPTAILPITTSAKVGATSANDRLPAATAPTASR